MNKPYDKTKIGRLVLGLFALASAAYLLLLYFVNQRVITVDVSGCDTAAAETMEYKIEEIKCQYDYVQISGYAYEPGVSLDKADTVILAHDPVSDIYYRLPTENVKKTKLTKNADDSFNYDYAQFQSVTLRKKIPSGCRVCIWYRGNEENRLISTDEVIFY